jgi:hypothetical protein
MLQPSVPVAQRCHGRHSPARVALRNALPLHLCTQMISREGTQSSLLLTRAAPQWNAGVTTELKQTKKEMPKHRSSNKIKKRWGLGFSMDTRSCKAQRHKQKIERKTTNKCSSKDKAREEGAGEGGKEAKQQPQRGRHAARASATAPPHAVQVPGSEVHTTKPWRDTDQRVKPSAEGNGGGSAAALRCSRQPWGTADLRHKLCRTTTIEAASCCGTLAYRTDCPLTLARRRHRSAWVTTRA